MAPRVVFMGSPDFAIPSLQLLSEQYSLVGVVTQPDRPAGRGQMLTPPPVKNLAASLGLPVIQPSRLRDPEAMEQLNAWSPELIVVAAFGQILRPAVLALPRLGCLNVHGSLLPRWRGAAPIHAAILAGDEQTGVTIMRMDPGIDTGDMLAQRATPIAETDTTETLSTRLALIGAELLLATLPGYLDGTILPQPQPAERATYAPMLKKEDGQLDFTQPAAVLARKVRAYQPWPGAFTHWQGQPLKIGMAHAEAGPAATPGQTLTSHHLPAIATADGLLVLDALQPAGKRMMDGKIFISGARGWGAAPVS
ncbi:MAG TPA: methionyl-tRNA formyltransferase [Anaerolineaceae bacterium]|jgi:methionyl-tRNA formyltransferase